MTNKWIETNASFPKLDKDALDAACEAATQVWDHWPELSLKTLSDARMAAAEAAVRYYLKNLEE